MATNRLLRPHSGATQTRYVYAGLYIEILSFPRSKDFSRGRRHGNGYLLAAVRNSLQLDAAGVEYHGARGSGQTSPADGDGDPSNWPTSLDSFSDGDEDCRAGL